MRHDKPRPPTPSLPPLTPSPTPLSTPLPRPLPALSPPPHLPHPSPQSVPWNFDGGTYYAPEEWKVFARTYDPSYPRDMRFVDTQEYFDGRAADMYRIGTVALQILEQITWPSFGTGPLNAVHANYPVQPKL